MYSSSVTRFERGLETLAAHARVGIARRGYHYESYFEPVDDESSDKARLVALARLLGAPLPLAGLPDEYPVIVTGPEPDAPPWRPFNRGEAIGWHNDFSTLDDRPRLSLAWVVRADPAGDLHGAWRAASVADMFAGTIRGSKLLDEQLIHQLSHCPLPFGYVDRGRVTRRLVLEQYPEDEDADVGSYDMRFYARAMREGRQVESSSQGFDGRHDDHSLIETAISAIEAAADVVGETLPASHGALLITDNRRSLHDRLPQTTRCDEPLRQAYLCFATAPDQGAGRLAHRNGDTEVSKGSRRQES